MIRVFHRLHWGDAKDAERLTRRNPAGIATVITVCESPVRDRDPRIRYLDFPLVDGEEIGGQQLASILSTIAYYVAQGPVLVHCLLGRSRSPAIVAAYLDRVGYLDFQDALSFLAHLRSDVLPSQRLTRSVERALRQRCIRPIDLPEGDRNDHSR